MERSEKDGRKREEARGKRREGGREERNVRHYSSDGTDNTETESLLGEHL